MGDLSPLASVMAGPHLRTVANLDGRKVVVVEPLQWVEPKRERPARLSRAGQAIVHMMREAAGPVSAAQISVACGLSITAIPVHIHRIRKCGVPIERAEYGQAAWHLAEYAAWTPSASSVPSHPLPTHHASCALVKASTAIVSAPPLTLCAVRLKPGALSTWGGGYEPM